MTHSWDSLLYVYIYCTCPFVLIFCWSRNLRGAHECSISLLMASRAFVGPRLLLSLPPLSSLFHSLSAGFTCSHLYIVTADVNSSNLSANLCLGAADFGFLCTLTVIFYTVFILLLIHLVLPKCISPFPSLPASLLSLPVNGCFVWGSWSTSGCRPTQTGLLLLLLCINQLQSVK